MENWVNANEFDNSLFDQLEIMRNDIIQRHHIDIDKEKVFTKDAENHEILVDNTISTIYSLKIDGTIKWFKTHEDLKSYVLNIIIKQNAMEVK